MGHKAAILALRAENKSYREIEDLVGCARSTIAYHCQRAGLAPGVPARPMVPVELPHPELVEQLVKEGTSRLHIADALGVPHALVTKWCVQRKLKSENALTGYPRLKRHRRNKKILAVLWKGGRCVRCGYCRNLAALEFHHPDPTAKEFTASYNTHLAWKRLKAEIEKCLLLCANCHREEHNPGAPDFTP